MMASSHRKQVLLFLAAIVLPSMALTFLTLQIIRQGKELDAKRLQEDRSRRAREIGQVLLARLETIKRDEVQQQIRCDKTSPCAYIHPETRLIANEKDGRLTLPWEMRPVPAQGAGMEPAAAALVRKAEAAEFVAKDLPKSAEIYRSALSLIAGRGRKQFLRLDLARVLRKAGQSSEATAIYRELATLPSEFKDEDGLPLCLYASEALLDQGEQKQEILPIIQGIVSSPGRQQPLVYYRLRDLAAKILAQGPNPGVHDATEKILGSVQQRIQDIEAAAELQRSFMAANTAQNPEGISADSPRWVLANQGHWLVAEPKDPGMPEPSSSVSESIPCCRHWTDRQVWSRVIAALCTSSLDPTPAVKRSDPLSLTAGSCSAG